MEALSFDVSLIHCHSVARAAIFKSFIISCIVWDKFLSHNLLLLLLYLFHLELSHVSLHLFGLLGIILWIRHVINVFNIVDVGPFLEIKDLFVFFNSGVAFRDTVISNDINLLTLKVEVSIFHIHDIDLHLLLDLESSILDISQFNSLIGLWAE